MSNLLIFGPGYTASRIANSVGNLGWRVEAVDRVRLQQQGEVSALIAGSSHILSSVPPQEEEDPVLSRFAAALSSFGGWLGYLSATGVYGDTQGAWVDESAPVGRGRRNARANADLAWLALGARVFRLPGIYGPGRSAFERLIAGGAYRVDQPGQMFSRIHVDDIVTAVIGAFDAPSGAYNIADDMPAPQGEVVAYAARLIGHPPPPLVHPDSLSPTARGFYSESRKVANGKAKRLLGWHPAYPSYRDGLRSLSANISPAKASALPTAAIADQR